VRSEANFLAANGDGWGMERREHFLNGISGQAVTVHGLWRELYIHCGGTIIFSGQAVQEPSQTMQDLQDQTTGGFRRDLAKWQFCQG